jgi:hypothetical protein
MIIGLRREEQVHQPQSYAELHRVRTYDYWPAARRTVTGWQCDGITGFRFFALIVDVFLLILVFANS